MDVTLPGLVGPWAYADLLHPCHQQSDWQVSVVCVFLTFICAKYIAKNLVDLDGICCAAEISSSDEAYSHFISSYQYSGTRILQRRFCIKMGTGIARLVVCWAC